MFSLAQLILIARCILFTSISYLFCQSIYSHLLKIAYWVQRWGAYFACFPPVKFLIDVLVTIPRALEIHCLSNQTADFVKNLLRATYNLFALPIFTSVFFSPRENDDQEERATENRIERQNVVSTKYNYCTQAENTQPLPKEPPRKIIIPNKLYPRYKKILYFLALIFASVLIIFLAKNKQTNKTKQFFAIVTHDVATSYILQLDFLMEINWETGLNYLTKKLLFSFALLLLEPLPCIYLHRKSISISKFLLT